MTTTLSLSRTRGDTYPIRMTMTNPDGTPMDLTNKQVILTANTEEDPIDTTNQVFQIVGTITDAEAGTVEFAPTLEQADNVGLFYFDVEVSDVENPVYLWAPDSEPVDGTVMGTSGQDGILWNNWTGDGSDTTFEYDTIDTVRVATAVSPSDIPNYYFRGPVLGFPFLSQGQFATMTVYLDGGMAQIGMGSVLGGHWCDINLSLVAAPTVTSQASYTLASGVGAIGTLPAIDATGWVAGWYVLGVGVDSTGAFKVQCRPQADPEAWLAETTDSVAPANWDPMSFVVTCEKALAATWAISGVNVGWLP